MDGGIGIHHREPYPGSQQGIETRTIIMNQDSPAPIPTDLEPDEQEQPGEVLLVRWSTGTLILSLLGQAAAFVWVSQEIFQIVPPFVPLKLALCGSWLSGSLGFTFGIVGFLRFLSWRCLLLALAGLASGLWWLIVVACLKS